MVSAALRGPLAARSCVFEVFARRLPDGRRYGVVAGTGRLIDELTRFRFGDDEIAQVAQFLDDDTVAWLRDYRFSGDIDGYREGELLSGLPHPHRPRHLRRGGHPRNPDPPGSSTMIRRSPGRRPTVSAAAKRPIIEMGGRRTHESMPRSPPRAAYLAGVAATSNLEAARTFGVPSAGTAARVHTRILRPGRPRREGRLRRCRCGRRSGGHHPARRHLRHHPGVPRHRGGRPGSGCGAHDSGDLGVLARQCVTNSTRSAPRT